MRLYRGLIFLICICCAVPGFTAERSEAWLPITSQDLQVTEVPGDPGAAAIQLYYGDFIDHKKKTEFIYKRIKVLNNKGLEHANVEIPTGGSFGIKDLKDLMARTIHPDGSIADFTGTPFEKTIIKGRGIKLVVLAFILPDVTPGCIIEYKYKIAWKDRNGADFWSLQHNLFTVKEEFNLRAEPPSPEEQVKWVRIATNSNPTQVDKENAALELENVPAFVPEDHMPPERNDKPAICFYYLPRRFMYAGAYWLEIGRVWDRIIEDFIGNRKEIREAAAQVIGRETDPEKKLRLLYARAQQVRNLTFERKRTSEEKKHEELKEDKNVNDVLQRGYGDRGDINQFFVALARAADFPAAVLLVSGRKDRFFNKEVLSLSQLDSVIADVVLNGKHIYLDPGTRFCPFGLLRWMQTSTKAMRPSPIGGVFTDIPPFAQDKAVTRRKANMTLSEDGSLKGDVEIQFQGLEALEHRLEAIDSDEERKKKDFEAEIKALLPSNAVVTLKEIRGLADSDNPLTATFTIELPSFASMAGKRLLLPALFQARQKDTFTNAQRKYPLYFPYAFADLDELSIKVPSGFSAESVPQQQDAKLPYAHYQNSSVFNAGVLVSRRTLLFNGIFFDMDKLMDLKTFFGAVRYGDEQQAVLRMESTTSAEKKD